MSVPTHLHTLNDKWDLYYHVPQNNNWSLDSYVLIKEGIEDLDRNVARLEETLRGKEREREKETNKNHDNDNKNNKGENNESRSKFKHVPR